ncbi:MAG: aminotransferase class IV [Steroidobacteraceae bacterium]|nr:aminotransferase class IV [Steroidobacteraceae bacterium]
MSAPLPIAYLDGQFLAVAEARISPLDRGFLFADAVYEVLPAYGGRPFLFTPHFDRLDRSCREIRLQPPHSRAEWARLLTGLVERNGGGDMYLYVHVSRGAENDRNHAIPKAVRPTVFAMAMPLPPVTDDVKRDGVAAITTEDPRWKRCDIKSTSLLGNVLAKTLAADAGATEAILLAGGLLREGSSTSVLVVRDGVLHAPPEGPEILPGTTRALVFELARRTGVRVRVEPVPEAVLRGADELLISFATRGVLPVTRLDGAAVGTGRPGPVWTRLYEALEAYKVEVASQPLY